MIYDSIAMVIGATPVVRLQRVSQRVGCQVFAKLECFNPVPFYNRSRIHSSLNYVSPVIYEQQFA